jgi:hypothetical protein
MFRLEEIRSSRVLPVPFPLVLAFNCYDRASRHMLGMWQGMLMLFFSLVLLSCSLHISLALRSRYMSHFSILLLVPW